MAECGKIREATFSGDEAGGPQTRGNVALKLRQATQASVVRPFRSIRGESGLSRSLYARLTGFSLRALADWESGKAPSEPALRRVREIERFRERLAEVVAADAIPAWLDTPNPAFEGLKPIEVIERGEIDRLWNMIFYLEAGLPS